LFPEEVAILQILAGKAAVALQSTLLLESFNDIATISPGDNIQSVLERITQSAVVQLHADPVILYRYDAETHQLEPQAIAAGNFNYPEVHIVTTKNEMAKLILETKESQYFTNEEEYYRFLSGINRTWHSERFTEDFWHREKIKSLAALKLEYGGEVVGMMYINYREPQIFPESQKRLMEVFAAQAASVIYNAKIWERNDRYWETRRADSFSLSVNEIVSSLAHNSGNLIFSANLGLGDLQEYLKKVKGDTVPKNDIEERVNSLNDTLSELTDDFNRLKDYRRLGKLNLTPCDINELILQSLHFIRTKLRKQRITVDTRRLAERLPRIPADHNQIQHVFLNLFLNAAEAMQHKGKLAVATKLVTDNNKDFVQIRVSDNGSGIAAEHRNQIFTPNFTTKKLKEGSGMGLPIVRYIVDHHGGKVDFTSVVRRGSNFFVYLPVS
jgi:signal transduction histidine kinase